MSNVNTIADAIIQNGQVTPVTLALTTQAHTQFKYSNGATVLLTVPNPEYPIDTAIPFPPRSLDAIPFIIRAAGKIQLGRGVVWQIDINQGSGLTPAIVTTGAQTSPLGAGLYQDNFLIEAECMWDSSSTNLRGIQYGWAGNNSIAQSQIVLSSPANLAALQFNVAASVQNANPGNL